MLLLKEANDFTAVLLWQGHRLALRMALQPTIRSIQFLTGVAG